MELNELFSKGEADILSYIASFTLPWQALCSLGDYIRERGRLLPCGEFREVAPQVWVHKTAVIAHGAYIGAPTIIGKNTQIRHGAFIRGNALIGSDCVIGNSTEIKNAIIFDKAQLPHYNYIGDSIVGYRAHMGAGAIASNVRMDKGEITLTYKGKVYATGLRKLGALIGDGAEIGCSALLNPGTVIGNSAVVYPLSSVRGEVAGGHTFKACPTSSGR